MKRFLGVVPVAALIGRSGGVDVGFAERIVDLVENAFEPAVGAMAKPQGDGGKLVKGVAGKGHQPDDAAAEVYARGLKLGFSPGPQVLRLSDAVILAIKREQIAAIDTEGGSLPMGLIEPVNIDINQRETVLEPVLKRDRSLVDSVTSPQA